VPTLVPLPTEESPTAWHGEYYANPDLGGRPAMVRQDSEVAFDWQEESPDSAIPADNFSVRWTKQAWFEEALYTFYANIDDGMRLYVDDELLIDEWRDAAAREVTASRHMSAGAHTVRVEYYERGHVALARLWWAEDHSFVNWQGRYYADPDLEGNPVMVRDDPRLIYNWGLGSPGEGVPEDRFSVRWTRAMRLVAGEYRFRILVDDGARLWVDERLLIDAWYDHELHELVTTHTLAGVGPHFFQVDYYDSQFDARIDVSWERIGDPVYPYWKAEYFENQDLAGDAVLIRDERTLQHDWGDGSPAPSLPADHFSARWTRVKAFEPGRYRFTFEVDDGIRFYVDGELVLDEWHNAWEQTHTVEVDLPANPELTIEYYEDGGGAKITFEYERL
jgi:hypothetical protein